LKRRSFSAGTSRESSAKAAVKKTAAAKAGKEKSKKEKSFGGFLLWLT